MNETQPSLMPYDTDGQNGATVTQSKPRIVSGQRANDLPGKEWTRNSISIWSDIRKDAEEVRLNHPAIFPKALVRRCLESFTRTDQRFVLDPFSGSGSTVLAAWGMNRVGIGFEISPEYNVLAKRRLADLSQVLFDAPEVGEVRLIEDDARNICSHLLPESVDICVTSPPYWDILTQRRSADYKEVRNYGDSDIDLGRVSEYSQFIEELALVFEGVTTCLKPGSYCLINLMDIRKGPDFFPFHADLAFRLRSVGLKWDDVIIWDRRSEYNNMRPLGFPSVFRINKAHEYILVMQKPK